jgi:phosphate transport system permease protein
MASVIANQFSEATSNLYVSSLVQIGLLLFAVTVMINLVALLLVTRLGVSYGERRA